MMKRLLLVAAMSTLLLPALADARGWQRSDSLFQLQGQQIESDPVRYQPNARDSRSRAQDRDRLTEDERRRLHRDLDRARFEIYRRGRGR